MHIADGVLPPAVWASGFVVTAGAVAVSARRFDEKHVPQVAVLTSLFFVASLIQVPLGFTSVHLLLTGVMGIVLGWLVLPSILVALFLQYVLVGVGGLTTLGVNTVTMGSGAVASRWIFVLLWRPGSSSAVNSLRAFLASTGGIIVSGAVFFLTMAAGGKELGPVAGVILTAHAPLVVLDGLVTVSAVGFLLRVKPEILELRGGRPPAASGRSLAALPLSLSGLVFLAPFLVQAPVLAHSMEAFARRAGDRVKVEAFFVDGTPVRGADVTVTQSGGKEVARGKTDDDGFFFFRPVRAAALQVAVEDAGGHRKMFRIPAAKLEPLFSPASAAAADAGPGGEGRGATEAGRAAGSAAGGEPLAGGEEGPLRGVSRVVRVLLGLVVLALLSLAVLGISHWRARRHAS